MGNSYTEDQALNIVNSPAVAWLRAYGSTAVHVKSVFTNSMSFAASPEQFTQAFDDTGDTYDAISTDVAELSFDTAMMFDADYMELIGGGLFGKSTTEAGATTVEDQVFNGFVDTQENSIELINASGNTFIGSALPAITSVTGSIAGVLAADDDYFLVANTAAYSGYTISFDTAGTGALSEDEVITIVFNEPEVVAEVTVDYGGIKNYEPVEGYIETMNRAGKTVRISFYKAYYNAAWNMTGAAENSPEASTSNFVFSVKPDTSRPIQKQLYSFKVLK